MASLVVPDHIAAFLLATIAAWATLGALRNHDSVAGPARLKLVAVILVPLIWATVTAPLTAVMLYYLTGFLLVYAIIYGLTVLLSISRYGLDTTIDSLRPLPESRHTAPEPAPDQQTGRQRQGPQPPQKAVQIDRELVYNRWEVILDADDIGMSRGRINRLKDRLTDAERDQLKQFWQWQDDTRRGQDTSSTPPLTQQTGTGQRPTLPDGTPVVFKDQLQDR